MTLLFSATMLPAIRKLADEILHEPVVITVDRQAPATAIVQSVCPVEQTRKAELLSNVVEHIDIKSFDARPIVDAMKKMSFTSRDLGRATDIYNQMLADPDCSVILVIAGSTSAGGCMDLYAELIRNNMVDAVVGDPSTD